VLEAAIDAGCGSAIVCTQGHPVVVVSALLRHLHDTGCELLYHGDFDWPGITIANVLVSNHRCRPWRFEAADYLDALSRLASVVPELPPLAGPATEACWDAALTREMTAAGRCVHEELVIERLLADLARG
jgi:uncharacterized protein (TIGR02679 family)